MTPMHHSERTVSAIACRGQPRTVEHELRDAVAVAQVDEHAPP